MSGFFKIWRDLFEKPIWLKSTPEQKVILITLIKMANWKDAKWEWKGRPYNCSPGEFITSYNSIINACGKGVTHQNVRTAIKRFENYEFLTYQVTVGEYGGIKITVRNWDKYQNKINTSSNSSPTVRQQFANSSLTPNKEIKKERKEECINLSLSNSSTRARVGEREREILKSYCKNPKNGIKNPDGFMATIIKNGDYKEIIKAETKRLERKQQTSQKVVNSNVNPNEIENAQKAFENAKNIVKMIRKRS